MCHMALVSTMVSFVSKELLLRQRCGGLATIVSARSPSRLSDAGPRVVRTEIVILRSRWSTPDER